MWYIGLKSLRRQRLYLLLNIYYIRRCYDKFRNVVFRRRILFLRRTLQNLEILFAILKIFQ